MITDNGSESLVRLRLITTNAKLVDARKKRGLTQVELAELTGLKQNSISIIETLRANPTDEEMAKIASVLVEPIENLFPDELLEAVRMGVFSRRKAELTQPILVELTASHERLLLNDGGINEVENKMDSNLLKAELEPLLAELKPRERRVLELSFGLKDGLARTQAEVGRELKLTRGRVQQIEYKALYRIRRSRKVKKLKGYL